MACMTITDMKVKGKINKLADQWQEQHKLLQENTKRLNEMSAAPSQQCNSKRHGAHTQKKTVCEMEQDIVILDTKMKSLEHKKIQIETVCFYAEKLFNVPIDQSVIKTCLSKLVALEMCRTGTSMERTTQAIAGEGIAT